MRNFPEPTADTATQMVLGHLQHLAGRFEQYATGLLRSIEPKQSALASSEADKPGCPFMRVALAIGFTPKLAAPPAPPSLPDTECGAD